MIMLVLKRGIYHRTVYKIYVDLQITHKFNENFLLLAETQELEYNEFIRNRHWKNLTNDDSLQQN